MDYSLDEKDYAIFVNLHEDPFQSYNSLSKIVNLAPATVKDRMEKMKLNGFLRADSTIHDPVFGSRMKTELVAEYRPQSIGLTRVNVLFEFIENEATLRKLTNFCDLHPYTHYRGMVLKNSINLFTQFDVPYSAEKRLERALKEVQKELDIRNISMVKSEKVFHTYPDFSLWSGFKRNWEPLQQGDGANEFIVDTMWNEFLSKNQDQLTQPGNNRKYPSYSMSKLEAKLLRELTINAKVPLQFLSETYDRSKSVLSRKLKNLRENVIYRGHLLYDDSFFGLNNFQYIFGKFSKHSKLTAESLQMFLETTSLPLTATMHSNDDSFVLETVTSPILSTEFAKFIWEHTEPTAFNLNQLHIPKTMLYFFYHENYLGDNKWIEDEDAIIWEPLASI